MPSRLRLLLISYRFPWPLTRGDTLTVFKMAEYFGARHDVDLLCHRPQTPEHVAHVRPLVHDLITVPFSKPAAMMRLGRAALNGLPFQVAWCSSGNMRRAAEQLIQQRQYDIVLPYYVRPALTVQHARGPAKVVAMQLSMALQWARAAGHARSPLRRFFRRMEANRLARYESQMFSDFDKCLLISQRDRDHIRGWVDEKTFYNPHGVDTRKFAPRHDEPRNANEIIFTGLMQFKPNEDAVCYFAESILPLVLREVPDARFTIVGKNPTPAVRALEKNPAVTVTGTVASIADYLARAHVAVDPLRIGAGLQNKVLEAMSMGVPIVMTGVANEGIGATDGENCLIRDDPGPFAAAVLRLLRDDALHQRLSRAARQWICQNWTWEHHFDRLNQMLCDLAADTNPNRLPHTAKRPPAAQSSVPV